MDSIPRSKDDDYADDIVAQRRALCEAAAGRELPFLAGSPVPASEARGNIENFVGYAQVPIGIAGPLTVDTSLGERTVLVPMATNEGAMVASYSRGMRLFAAGAPPRARVFQHGLTQNPVLVYADAERATAAAALATEALDDLRAITARGTSHGSLLEVRPRLLGRRLILGLVFGTGDAIGINMAARATQACAEEFARRSGAESFFVHGQDVEKRANSRALAEGRGRSVVCDVTVKREALAELARATPEQLVEIQNTYRLGFAHLGTHNWAVQTANGLAAVLIACGQDAAYVTECATGFLEFETTPGAEGGDLYACLILPSLLLGTVGGGSGKGTAAECLDILGCRGSGKADLLAEILGATLLAGDLSLMAAFCSHEFVAAHERLGRNRPPR